MAVKGAPVARRAAWYVPGGERGGGIRYHGLHRPEYSTCARSATRSKWTGEWALSRARRGAGCGWRCSTSSHSELVF